MKGASKYNFKQAKTIHQQYFNLLRLDHRLKIMTTIMITSTYGTTRIKRPKNSFNFFTRVRSSNVSI